MTLAEVTATAQNREHTRLQPLLQSWAAELGLTPDEASTKIAAPPAWAPDAQPTPEPEHDDPEAGA